MLSFLREFAKGGVIKILMIILLLSFVLWGVGDMLRKVNHQYVVQINGRNIDAFEWDNHFRYYLSYFEKVIGRPAQKEEIKNLNLGKVFTQKLIQEHLVQLEAPALGFNVTDDMVKFYLATAEEFQKDNAFSKELFDSYLRNLNISEDNFITHLKSKIQSQFFTEVFQKDFIVGQNLIDEEARKDKLALNFLILTLGKDSSNDEGFVPGDLEALYEAKKEEFALPEIRKISYALIDEKNITFNAKVTDQEIEDFYNSQVELMQASDSGIKPLAEVKAYIKESILSERKEKALYELIAQLEGEINAGKKLKSLAHDHGLEVKRLESARLTDSLNFEGDKPLLAEAFAIDSVGEEHLKPLSQKASAIFVVEEIKPKQYKPFEAVKNELIALEKSNFKANKQIMVANKIVAEINSGKDVTAVAKEYNLNVQEAAFELNNVTKEQLVKYLGGEISHDLFFNARPKMAQFVYDKQKGISILYLNSTKELDKKIEVSQLKSKIFQIRREELFEVYMQSLQEKYDVKINEELINELVSRYY
jgi:peptidyl-prolyl cis-trans isomerase D